MTEKKLRMSFDPRTIGHLGIKMYSRLPNAMAELIANSWDACADHVKIYLNDEDPDNKFIVIEDDGIGMSFDDINTKFLRIGRNRREEGEKESLCGRIVTGRKGLGKLAFFGIGEVIVVESCKDGIKTTFTLNWNDIINSKDGKDYEPESSIEKCEENSNGTKITLQNLKRKTNFDVHGLSVSLAKLFNFPTSFEVSLLHNRNEKIIITNKMKFEGVIPEFQWDFPDYLEKWRKTDYKYTGDIYGHIFTTEKPISPKMRGITLFANGRMVNNPEFFGSSESSHFFSYTTGYLNVDFVDNWEEDVISTNRQSLDWENEKTEELRKLLKAILSDIHTNWRKERKEKRQKMIKDKTDINVKGWINTIPDNLKNEIETIIENIQESELIENKQLQTIENLHVLVPNYPNFHWRNIHPEIQIVSKNYYINKNYYTAFLEAVKRYVDEIKIVSGSIENNERKLMNDVFKLSGGILSVTENYENLNGVNFSSNTIQNIQEGQQFLSVGMVIGGRHPVSHEQIINLKETGFFTEKDCLDFLSLISHLFKRLENSVKK